MTPNIESRVAQIIERVTQEQFSHMMGPGVGRYRQYVESEPETVDGYALTFAVDEFLGPQGVGCIFSFYLRKDGRTWNMVDGHGPGYVEGTDQGWQETTENPTA